jgi:iron complex transport system substrate-binding protein
MLLRLPATVLAPFLLAALTVFASNGPASAGEFTDAAGRQVMLPARINRILPAEPNAEALVFVLAPDKLVGLSALPGRSALLPRASRLPVLGWRPRSNPVTMAETARHLRPDLIIDAGAVTPDRAAFADQVSQQTGIPYILVDDSFARMPTVLRATGALIGDNDRAIDLALFAEHAIAGLRGRLLIRPANNRPRVYYGLGPDGLTTALPGSPAGEAIDEAGAINVASPLGRGAVAAVTRDQLLGWDPEIIIAEDRSFYSALQRSPAWRRLSAVRKKHVYLEPDNPFGWIEHPSGVNRLIGLYWLSSLFYPDSTQEDLRATTCDFYDKFYELKLTNAQLEAMVRPAGAAPPESSRPIEVPLIGLGAAPPSTLPPNTPGAPSPSSPAPTLGAPSAAPATPNPLPASTATVTCAIPTGPSPYLPPDESITGAAPGSAPSATTPGAPIVTAPGVPPVGRRGRPSGLAPQ